MRGLRGVTIVLHDLGQLPDQRFGLFVCQFKVHDLDMGSEFRAAKAEAGLPIMGPPDRSFGLFL